MPLYIKCICSAVSMASQRYGHIYGTPGTLVGIFGPAHLMKLIFHAHAQQ